MNPLSTHQSSHSSQLERVSTVRRRQAFQPPMITYLLNSLVILWDFAFLSIFSYFADVLPRTGITVPFMVMYQLTGHFQNGCYLVFPGLASFVIISINLPPILLSYPLRNSVICIIVVICKVSGPQVFLPGKKHNYALAAVAQWTECQPVNQRVNCSTPSQGTRLGCRPGPPQ